jgi:hypothetical protein
MFLRLEDKLVRNHLSQRRLLCHRNHHWVYLRIDRIRSGRSLARLECIHRHPHMLVYYMIETNQGTPHRHLQVAA